MSELDDNASAREFRDELAKSLAERKPTLEEMRAWVDQQEARDAGSADACRAINGVFEPHHIRGAVVARRLLDFMDQSIEQKEGIALLFRAKAHQQRRRA
jgi:hypothetical protein